MLDVLAIKVVVFVLEIFTEPTLVGLLLVLCDDGIAFLLSMPLVLMSPPLLDNLLDNSMETLLSLLLLFDRSPLLKAFCLKMSCILDVVSVRLVNCCALASMWPVRDRLDAVVLELAVALRNHTFSK